MTDQPPAPKKRRVQLDAFFFAASFGLRLGAVCHGQLSDADTSRGGGSFLGELGWIRRFLGVVSQFVFPQIAESYRGSNF